MRDSRLPTRPWHGARLALAVCVVGVGAAGSAAASGVAAPLQHTDALLRTRPAPAAPATALVPSRRIDAFLQPATPGATLATSSPTRYAVPMLLSAVVPGAGEISLGHWWRGLPLVAVDVATWLGYAHYESEGKSLRDQFQMYADAHWSQDRWLANLPLLEDGKYYDPDDPPWHCRCSPPYIPADEDLREYYENLGKYRHFYPGWDDWTPTYDPEDPLSHRRIYSELRIDSNRNLDNASRLLGVAALTRVVSVIQSFWLVRHDSRSDILRFEPVAFGGMGSGMRVVARF